MSISEYERTCAKRTAGIYLCVAAFCILFSVVYEQFSHGVFSAYLLLLFLFPTVGGVLPFSAIGFGHRLRYPGRLAQNLYHSGLATLTVGSCISGVLEIYGTTSALVALYWAVGSILAILGLLCYLLE